MKKQILFVLFIFCLNQVFAQEAMSPEKLWEVKRVNGIGLSKNSQDVLYSVSSYNLTENKRSTEFFSIPLKGGDAQKQATVDGLMADAKISPDGKFKIITKEVKIQKVAASEYYPDMNKTEAKIYDGLNFRHWDSWEDGSYNHIFLVNMATGEEKDLMQGEAFDSPQQPFGGDEDFIWSPDGKKVLYVCKKKTGTAYATSTNTDIYAYEIATGKTSNLTEGMMGYDTEPAFSSTGTLAWMSMKRDGFEADKNDLVVKTESGIVNLTQGWDGTVSSFKWSADGKKLYFLAPIDGTIQLFEVDSPVNNKKEPIVRQLSKGDFDLTGIIAQNGNTLVLARNDINRATELYTYDLSKNTFAQLSHVNDDFFKNIKPSKVERRYITTTDRKKMLVYVIFPPDFDKSKKYPTLLYCQGGPQAPLTQMYSYRWNFQLMAAQGYIVVAPNRRGMPGHGVAWNEQISKDHGGQVMDDYLSAIDSVAAETYVDKSRLACVGASYGGYSVFYLAGNHQGRFKTFIAHDGIFNTKSMFGTTEELFFVDWDYGGNYWDKKNLVAQKSYTQFDPSAYVDKWDRPILIYQGGKDFRVPDGQAFEAFTAAQLKGLKSRLVYFPDENHWVLKPQNAIVWQREFFKWLKETL